MQIEAALGLTNPKTTVALAASAMDDELLALLSAVYASQ
jgi:hypothetical protein